MTRIVLLALLLTLPACKTMPSAMNCANAHRVHALATQALERACPIDLEAK